MHLGVGAGLAAVDDFRRAGLGDEPADGPAELVEHEVPGHRIELVLTNAWRPGRDSNP